MNYTPDNLPQEYREYILLALRNDVKYVILKRKLKEAVQRAKTTSIFAMAVKNYEDDYLRKVLKYFKTDEAIDAEYKKTHTNAKEIADMMSDADKLKMQIAIHTCIFALDNFDSNLRTVNSLIKKTCGETFEMAQFDVVRTAIGNLTDFLNNLHHDKCEEFEYTFADEAERIGDYLTNRVATFLRKVERQERKSKLAS